MLSSGKCMSTLTHFNIYKTCNESDALDVIDVLEMSAEIGNLTMR
jgi:hypothetical protein